MLISAMEKPKPEKLYFRGSGVNHMIGKDLFEEVNR